MTQNIQAFILPVAFLAIFYFFIIRPQRKRDKDISEMRSKLAVGDNIVTIGGIIGKIIKIKEDEVTIEVGADKTRFEIKKWAIGTTDKKPATQKAEETKPNEEAVSLDEK